MDPFSCPKILANLDFSHHRVMVKRQKHFILSKKLTLLMPKDFRKIGFFLPQGDGEKAKTLYTGPKLTLFDAQRF